MEPLSRILARLPGPAAPSDIPTWEAHATAAHAVARARTPDPATLRQLMRICQLLRSHVVREWERDRIAGCLARGCTRSQASKLLDFLIPIVRARKAAEGCVSGQAPREKRAG